MAREPATIRSCLERVRPKNSTAKRTVAKEKAKASLPTSKSKSDKTANAKATSTTTHKRKRPTAGQARRKFVAKAVLGSLMPSV